ncbi:HAMP domain-containing protein [bacterium]|jgi:adenylate cyclase|nr:HAMP domain-containing protein [bacterium]
MKVRFNIRTKLVGIINTVLLAAALAIIGFASFFFNRDNVARVQESNLETARLVAQVMKNDLNNLAEKMRLLGVTLMQNLPQAQVEAVQRPLFEHEKDLLSTTVFTLADGKARPVGQASNDALVKSLDSNNEEMQKILGELPYDKMKAGNETIQSLQLHGNIPLMVISLPLVSDDQNNVTHSVVAILKQDRFLRTVSNGTRSPDQKDDSDNLNTSYLVDSQGYLLAHPDQQKVLKRENVSHLEIVKQLISAKTINNGQTRFVDPSNGVAYLGAFKTVGFANIGVVTQKEEAMATKPARQVRNTSIYITTIVSVIGFYVIFLFSLSLTRPLISLVEATEEISKGNYQVKIKKTSNDEIGDLSKSFTEMTQGLAEREKIKNAFSKFHSKDIADKILSGEMQLTGERKKVTIFFSDIRSFTSISEKLEPEQVVELINGYMTRMVRIIFAHGGVVDKYVGDAIMAVYGTPISHENDSLRAVSAALRMRAELKRFNEDQAANGKPVIAIGMGMHTGSVVAGNIGSPERMEYTILGDNVNLTSRMESLTKEFKTDILISDETYAEIQEFIHCEARGTTKVKGKAEEVAVYEVINFKEGYEFIPPESGTTGESTFIGKTPPPFRRHELTPPPFRIKKAA